MKTASPASPVSENDPRRWVDDHGDALFRYALQRTHDRNTAEDLVQETLLAAIRSRDSFDQRSSLRTWMIGILRHKVVDFFRGRARDAADSASLEQAVEGLFHSRSGAWIRKPQDWIEPSTDERAELGAVLQGCMDRLPAAHAETLLLHELHGHGTKHLRELLHTTESNVWVMLHRARTALRECLERRWFGSAGARSSGDSQ